MKILSAGRDENVGGEKIVRGVSKVKSILRYRSASDSEVPFQCHVYRRL